MEQRMVGRGDWTTLPMPEEREEFTLCRRFSEAETALLMRGHLPEAMEDKWFWYHEDGKLYIHRSWTGYCVYIVAFGGDGETHSVTVNRCGEQYGCSDTEEDRAQLLRLFDWWTAADYDPYDMFVADTYRALRPLIEAMEGEQAQRGEGDDKV